MHFSKFDSVQVGSATLFTFCFFQPDPNDKKKRIPLPLNGPTSVVFTSPSGVRTEHPCVIADALGGVATFQSDNSLITEVGIWKLQGIDNVGVGSDHKSDVQLIQANPSL